MKTWVMPEFISWKIMSGRKVRCKGSGYNSWYSTLSTNCVLPKGSYKVVCMDGKRQGFKGGYLLIGGKKFCHKNFMWRAGAKKVESFVLRRR
jgi:hypothetical protein